MSGIEPISSAEGSDSPAEPANGPSNQPLWVFGYGSLLWDPGFAFDAVYPALVHGWHRRFSLLSTRNWGTAERPGLSAALHAGGCVAGRVYRVAHDRAAETFTYLAQREHAYRHIDVTARTDKAGDITARTFAWNPANERFAPALAVEEQCFLIGQGEGVKGQSISYIRGVARELAEDGRRCSHSAAILERIGPAV